MLTARDTVEDRILGLRAGADDYLVKPFSLMELEARIKALVRRSRRHVTDVTMRIGSLELDRGHTKRGATASGSTSRRRVIASSWHS